MDQQPYIPKINKDIKREEEKKRGGLACLLSRLGFGSRGAGGLGGAAGLGGGLLATKAGIIGLVLVGTTVAGSIGVVGYKLFGPSSADRVGADFSSIFAAKPKSAAGSAAGQDRAASADGISRSLDYLVRANAKREAPEQDQAAAAAGAAAGPAVAPPLNNDNAPGQGPAVKLKTDKKIGELSKVMAAGSGGASSSAAGAGLSGALAAGARGGSLGALPGAAARSAAGGLRGLSAGAQRLGAFKQLGLVQRDQKGAVSSMAAGRTYDGNAQAPGQIGPDAGMPGAETGAGAGNGAAAPNPVGNPGVGGDGQRFPQPPAVAATNVTPWQAAINTAMLLMAAACVLLLLANMVAKMSNATGPLGQWARPLAVALAAMAAACGLAVVFFGSMIGGGAFGQPLQGQILTLAGGFITAAAVVAALGLAAHEGALHGGVLAVTMICGGAALAATAWAYMSTPKQYPASTFQDGRPPDWDHK